MSTDMVRRPNGALASPEPQDERLATLRRLYAPGATAAELEVFGEIANGLGLSPGMKQVYAIQRYDKRAGRQVLTVQLGIDGLRLIAQRSGHYAGTDAPLWCGADGQWTDIWLDEKQPPAGCKVGVWRTGATRPTVGVVLYREFKQETPFWRDMPANQLAIRAEAKALRMAFQADIQAAEAALADAEIELPEPTPRVVVDEPAPSVAPAPEARQLAAPASRTQAASGTEAAATASTATRAPVSAPGGGATLPIRTASEFFAAAHGLLGGNRGQVAQQVVALLGQEAGAFKAAHPELATWSQVFDVLVGRYEDGQQAGQAAPIDVMATRWAEDVGEAGDEPDAEELSEGARLMREDLPV